MLSRFMIDIFWGFIIGGALVVLSIILFLLGFIAKTIRTILFIAGIIILILSGIFLYFGKIPFL